ncbi:MAG: radical SAM protein, partial [Candidatus Omnitrophica bacterium]|nr:radical SAM protein [Candidatus Omnitrophota bacterium]
MNTKIFLLSLGCPRNLVDSEVLTGLLKEEGFTFEDDARKADLFILNTCAFIDSAKKESIDTILELAALKKERLEEKIPLIVTGCLSQRYPNALLKEIPEIDGIFGSSDFIKIPQFIKGMLDKNKAKRIHENAPCVTKKPHFLYNHRLARDFITPRHYAYVKLQEGCRNHCSYCLIPTLRGPYRSRTLDSVVKEVIQLRKKGVQEINLIGQDITLYGIDRYRSVRLVSLLKKLAEIMKDGWIRLLYTHPAHYSDELIEIISGEKPICKYLDIP